MFQRILVSLLLLVTISTATDAADFGLYGFDVRAGAVVPTDWDTGFLIGASVNIGEVIDGLYLYPAVTYSTAEDSDSGFDLDVTSLAVGAEVRYFPAGERRGWYFGGGPYLHFLERDIVVTNVILGFPTRASFPVDGEEFGPTGVVGYQLGEDGTGFLVEARYSVVSGYDTLQLLGGFSF